VGTALELAVPHLRSANRRACRHLRPPPLCHRGFPPDRRRDLGHVYLRGEQADYLGSLIGVCASALLAIIALNLPLLLAGALTIALGATLALVMLYTTSAPPRARTALHGRRWGPRRAAGSGSCAPRPVLLMLLAVSAFSGMSSEGFDRLWEGHLIIDVGLPRLGDLDQVIWFAS
jgi:hypothetical protein